METQNPVVQQLIDFANSEKDVETFEIEDCGLAIRSAADFWTKFPNAKSSFDIDVWVWDSARIRIEKTVSNLTNRPGLFLCTSDSRIYQLDPVG